MKTKKTIVNNIMYREIITCYKTAQILIDVITTFDTFVDEEKYKVDVITLLTDMVRLTDKVYEFIMQTNNEFKQCSVEVVTNSKNTLNELLLLSDYTDNKTRALIILTTHIIIAELNSVIISYYNLLGKNAIDFDYIKINVDVTLDNKQNTISFKPETTLSKDLKDINIIYCFQTDILGDKITTYHTVTITDENNVNQLDLDWRLFRTEFLMLMNLFIMIKLQDDANNNYTYNLMSNIVNNEISMIQLEYSVDKNENLHNIIL